MKRILPITLAMVLASSTLTYANSPQKPVTTDMSVSDEATKLVPVRETANKYGYTVTWNNKDKTLTLKKKDLVFVGTVGSTDYVLNGEIIPIENSPVQIINNVAYVPSVVFNTLLSLEQAENGNEVTTDLEETNDYYINLSEAFINDLLNEDYVNGAVKLDGLIDSEYLETLWVGIVATLGDFEKIDKEKDDVKIVDTGDGTGYVTVAQYLEFENGGLIVYNTFSNEDKFIGFNINYYTPEGKDIETPSTIEEIDYKVGVAGTQDAKLTKAKNSTSDTVVLMVSGSGPNDLNVEILGNKPFRDIAWGLAEQGIDTFRFDKVTHSASKGEMVIENPETFTIQEEYVNDVVEIREMLLDMGYEHIYLLGHSQGAMVAPRIYDEVDGGFDGVILMAGTPRTLTEVQIMQGLDYSEKLPQELKEQNLALIEAEVEKYENLDKLTDEELLKENIFGIPAYYVKEADSYNTSELAKEIDKPVLVVQGSDDFQVKVNEDYELWKDVFADNKDAEFILYDGLGHLFTEAPENPTNTVNDYIPSQLVYEQVILDIANFIKNN